MDSISKDEYLALLRHFRGWEVEPRVEAAWPVTQLAYEALTETDIDLIERRVEQFFGPTAARELESWRARSFPHYRREILRFGCAVEPARLWDKTRMTDANPPLDVHSMIRKTVFVGDVYSGDMIVAALQKAGLAFEPGRRYLDFGCSSAALVRNMWAAFPTSTWAGCDPVETSIAWASAQFPAIELSVSAQEPPLSYAQGVFDGGYAISIWSHFSERAAVAWFDEMHRVLKPGGFLVFTTHGVRSIYHYLDLGHLSLPTAQQFVAQLSTRGHAFQEVWSDRSEAADFLQTSDWGNGYFTHAWVQRVLGNSWRIVYFDPGINQQNQDLYVLVRG